jgi:hypothetical protein
VHEAHVRTVASTSQHCHYLVSTQPTSDGSTRMYSSNVDSSAVIEAEIHVSPVSSSPFRASERKSPIAPRTTKLSYLQSRDLPVISGTRSVLQGRVLRSHGEIGCICVVCDHCAIVPVATPTHRRPKVTPYTRKPKTNLIPSPGLLIPMFLDGMRFLMA